MTRTVADAAMLLNVLAGPDDRDRYSLPKDDTDYLQVVAQGAKEGLRGLRVAWSPNLGYAPIEPEVREIAEQAARRFSELGVELEEADPGFSNPYDIFSIFWVVGITASLSNYLPEKADLLDAGLRRMVEYCPRITGLEVGKAMAGRAALWDTVRRFFEKYDLLLTPTMPQTAFELGIDGPDSIAGQSVEALGWTPFTFPFNMTGQPAASVPCGFTQAGLPVGLQIVGRRQADASVMRAAAAFEALQPWAQHRPRV
jgi:aspartyl-tRNA(Asn)/glutamyl-tRNA(Gln) amidotransferase subunit A